MNLLSKHIDFTTVEDGITKLKDAVGIRDQMGGALYWNMLNDDACAIATKVLGMGGNREELSKILGEGTHF